MDSQKAQLEATIRARRARLDRRLHRLEGRIETVKDTVVHTGKKIGVITGIVVIAFAVLGTITIITRQILAARRRGRIVLFAR